MVPDRIGGEDFVQMIGKLVNPKQKLNADKRRKARNLASDQEIYFWNVVMTNDNS